MEWGDGGDPAYGSGNDAGFEGVVGESVRGFARLVEHCCGGDGVGRWLW